MPHLNEKIDFTVEVFIVHKNKVLLRKHDKYGIWLSVGGHIEPDEDPNEAAVREVKEEVGLDITLIGDAPISRNGERYRELIPPKFVNRHNINDIHEHVAFTYFAKADTDSVSQSEKEKSDSIRWFTFEELDDLQYDIRPHIRHYAKTALQCLSLLQFEPILCYNIAMYNWSTDVEKLKKDKEKYTIWKLEQMANFGLGGEKIDKKELRKYWSKLHIDPARRKFLKFLLDNK